MVRPSPSSFRGSLRLGELGVTVLCRVEYSCRVVAGLVILQEWTFVGTFPPLNTFPTGPRPVFFRFTVVVALFPVVLSVFCFRSCPFGRLFLPVLARSFLGCGCRSISSYCPAENPAVDLTVFCFRSCPFALVIILFLV